MMFSDLPRELESEILCRVPATSLKKLQSTCKRWYALFKDSKFIEDNLAKAAKQHLSLMLSSNMVFLVSINNRNRFDPCLEFTCKSQSLEDSKQADISEIYHCDGLLLCTTTDNRLLVWNPLTGQRKWIQSSKRHRRIREFFLGYDKSRDTYKILSFGYHDNSEELPIVEYEIYEFNTGSWRVLDDAPNDYFIFSNGVSLKGGTYCFVINKEDFTFILKFDFATERFSHLSLPLHSEFDADEAVILSVVREENLALLHHEFFDSDMKIWIADTKIDEAKDLSWTEFLVVDHNKLKTWTSIKREMSFLVDEESKMVVCCDTDMVDKDRTRIFVVGENINKQVYKGIEEGSEDCDSFLISYVPSLVRIPATQSNILDANEKGEHIYM